MPEWKDTVNLPRTDFRRACRGYAERFIGAMTEQFQRLGVFGAWDQPYVTMNFRYQASIARALGRFVERGLVYKGKKPVHWCIHCRTALAEAEVEYKDHTSPSIYVEFALAEDGRAELARRVPALAGRDVSVLIWTTTPWTIPSNLAIALHPDVGFAGSACAKPDPLGRRRSGSASGCGSEGLWRASVRTAGAATTQSSSSRRRSGSSRSRAAQRRTPRARGAGVTYLAKTYVGAAF